MKNLKIKNIKGHPSQSLAKANASRDLQINFNQAEDALMIPTESRHDHKCGSTTQSGRSMIEMLGVLAIIGVLSVGGIAGYSKAMTKYRINKTIEQITLIAGNVRTFFAPQRNYSGLDYTILKKAKLVPDEMWEDGKTSPQNVWGNDVDVVTMNKAKNGDNQGFRITYYLPEEEEICIELLTQDWTTIGATGLDYGGISHTTLPLDINEAVSTCSADVSTTFTLFIDVNKECTSRDNCVQ